MFFTFLNYIVIIIFGVFGDFLRQIGVDKRKGAVESNNKVIYYGK